jgi:hypothetical protein
MSYEEKLARAKELVEAHCQAAVGGDAEAMWSGFHAKLVAAGGTSDEALKACSFEDLEECGLPKLLAKSVAQVFRGRDESRRGVSTQRASSMSVQELVDLYDPREADNAVGTRLKTITKGLRCVVFNRDGSVNTAVMAELVNAIREGFPERAVYLIDGNPEIVYHVGDRPDLMFDEDPLYPSYVLQPNGDSTEAPGLNWSGVSQGAKVLVYLGVRDTREIRVGDINDAHLVFELASSEEAVKKLRSRYTKTAVRYDELERLGQLPVLKTVRAASRKENPFGGGQNRSF